MKKVSIILMLLSMAISTAIAIPAKRGLWKTLTLANGSEVKAMLMGDEFGHFWKAEDGKCYISNGESYELVNTSVFAKKTRALRKQANAKRTKKFLDMNIGSYFGKKKGLIILVNFNDVKFNAQHTNELYQKIANKEGYNEGNFKGSIADYFKAQSRGLFELNFDIVGPVTVSKSVRNYGGNDSQGNDKHPGEMVVEAVTLAKDKVADWHQYDWNNDGEVDQGKICSLNNPSFLEFSLA